MQKANASHKEEFTADEMHFVFTSIFSFPNASYLFRAVFLDIKPVTVLSASLRFW